MEVRKRLLWSQIHGAAGAIVRICDIDRSGWVARVKTAATIRRAMAKLKAAVRFGFAIAKSTAHGW